MNIGEERRREKTAWAITAAWSDDARSFRHLELPVRDQVRKRFSVANFEISWPAFERAGD